MLGKAIEAVLQTTNSFEFSLAAIIPQRDGHTFRLQTAVCGVSVRKYIQKSSAIYKNSYDEP